MPNKKSELMKWANSFAHPLPKEGQDHNPCNIIASGTLEEDRRKRKKVVFTLL